jgi:flagellar hook-associated protein 1 FlgK
LPRYRSILDDLANTFRRAVNAVNTTGLGLSGRFHSLEGLNPFFTDTPVSELGYGVSAGSSEKLVITVEDESTGELTQYELALDTTEAADSFLADLRDAINAGVDHVSASISEGRLNLQAEDGYAFEFAAQYDSNPAGPGDITALDPTSPAILDAYTGSTDLQYDVSFVTGGEVGTDGITIQVSVSEPSGPVLRTFTRQLDGAYDPGDVIQLENGMKLSLSAGNVNAGDSFSFTAHASTDTAGVLDALGLNVFLTGQGAADIRVADRISQDPLALACATGESPGDNHKLLELQAVESAKLFLGGTATLSELWGSMVAEVASAKVTKSVQQDNVQLLVKDLQDRRDSVSGVSIDEETISLTRSQTVYEGMLKFIGALNQVMSDLLDLL